MEKQNPRLRFIRGTTTTLRSWLLTTSCIDVNCLSKAFLMQSTSANINIRITNRSIYSSLRAFSLLCENSGTPIFWPDYRVFIFSVRQTNTAVLDVSARTLRIENICLERRSRRLGRRSPSAPWCLSDSSEARRNGIRYLNRWNNKTSG